MIDIPKLRGLMAEKNKTGKEIAEKIGIVPETFYYKLKKGIFNNVEIEIIMKALGIDDPKSIFFADFVSSKETESAH